MANRINQMIPAPYPQTRYLTTGVPSVARSKGWALAILPDLFPILMGCAAVSLLFFGSYYR